MSMRSAVQDAVRRGVGSTSHRLDPHHSRAAGGGTHLPTDSPGGPMTIRRGKTSPGTTPTGLPVLATGVHLAPEDGTCLMEYASVLAGEPFSDRPRCTDPMLATLVRLVNDATTDSGRHPLGVIAPDLVAASRTDATGSASLVLGTLLRAVEFAGGSPALRRYTRRAARRVRRVNDQGLRGRLSRRLEVAHRHGSGRRGLMAAVDATATLLAEVRDAALCGILIHALSRHPSAASAPSTAGETSAPEPQPVSDSRGRGIDIASPKM